MIQNPVIPSFELGTLIGNFVGLGILAAAILTLVYLVWGGIEWISSGGDKAGMEAAKSRLTNAIIGLTITICAWAFMTIISTFLGFPFPCLPVPALSGVNSSKCPVNQQGQAGVCSIGGQACSSSVPCPAGQGACIYTQSPPGQPGNPTVTCTTSQIAAVAGHSCTNSTGCCVCASVGGGPGSCRAAGCSGLNPSDCAYHGVLCTWNGTACVFK